MLFAVRRCNLTGAARLAKCRVPHFVSLERPNEDLWPRPRIAGTGGRLALLTLMKPGSSHFAIRKPQLPFVEAKPNEFQLNRDRLIKT
jgi:hypothetical protein